MPRLALILHEKVNYDKVPATPEFDNFKLTLWFQKRSTFQCVDQIIHIEKNISGELLHDEEKVITQA